MDSFSDIININHEFNQYQINFYFELGNGGAFMKRMKKLTSIGLVLAMTVGLTAVQTPLFCGELVSTGFFLSELKLL